jgi:hypothetical protein
MTECMTGDHCEFNNQWVPVHQRLGGKANVYDRLEGKANVHDWLGGRVNEESSNPVESSELCGTCD